MLKHIAQVTTTVLANAKLHQILAQFPDHDLSDHRDREEIVTAILIAFGDAIGSAVDGTLSIFKKGGGGRDNPFF